MRLCLDRGFHPVFAQRQDAMMAALCRRFGISVPDLDPFWLDDLIELAQEDIERARHRY